MTHGERWEHIQAAARRIVEDVQAHPLVTMRQAVAHEFSTYRIQWDAVFRTMKADALTALSAAVDQQMAA